MAVEYEKIRKYNKDRYGWDIERIGQRIFTDTYADRTHFIFELLQNAEDAIARRGLDWNGPRTVSFDLTRKLLRVSHFGDPFNEDDVRGICGIAESTKQLTDIGRFGIGFKSVYAFTRRPEIHSGHEDFTIESFVWPTAAPLVDRKPDETVFLIPFKSVESSDQDKIADGLRRLGMQTLLFLRHVKEVKWSIQDDDSGQYLRDEQLIDTNSQCDVRRITVVGQVNRQDNIDAENWLVFSRQVNRHGTAAGHVEIAFFLDTSNDGDEYIKPVAKSPLVVFFPTVLETRLGFLLQGPYQTTPNRDNIPQHNEWNQHLISETALLLKDALRWLKNKNRLDTNVLRSLPITQAQFSATMFEALFDATKATLSSEPLLPQLEGGYISASSGLLGGSEPIRSLFSPEQLSALFPNKSGPAWLTSDITTNRTPRLRTYLMNELSIEEPTPATMIRKCDGAFLEDQSDEWIQELYEFLNDRRHLLRPQSAYRFPYTQHHQLYDVPLVRLENGRHITAETNGQVQAFLPTNATTDFPTVRATTCATAEARAFLSALGLREPDPIDDVIENILPRYEHRRTEVTVDQYESDISRILSAYTDSDFGSSKQRQRLVDQLRRTPFVMSADSVNSPMSRARPDELYLRTERLLSLFSGVKGVWFVAGEFECLEGADISDLLRKCGATPHLRPVKFSFGLKPWPRTIEDYPEIKREYSTRDEHIDDYKLLGLDLLLESLPRFNTDQRAPRAKLLWQALIDLAGVGQEHFSGLYHWFYYNPQSTAFDASFVKLLNDAAWIPSAAGDLCSPASICFDDLGWQENAFLQSKIVFEPPAVDRDTVRVLRSIGIADDVVEKLKQLPRDELSELFRNALQRTTRRNRGMRQKRIEGESETVDEGADEQADSSTRKFSEYLFQAMTPDPPYASYKNTLLPHVGPNTVNSALRDTIRSNEKGRKGRYEVRESKRFILSKEAKEVSQKVREMLEGDYGKRCQICGATFLTRAGEVQVFANHVVNPASDFRTNHFGNLLSLCGWHYALIGYGQWVFVNPATNAPVENDDELQTLLNDPVEEISDDGSSYIALPIKFWSVYREWRSDPEDIEEKIRFSGPHWTYLCKLLET